MSNALVARGDSVALIDDMSTGKSGYLNPAAELYEMDIGDDDVSNAMKAVRPDVVFHVAAQISVSVSAREPKFDAETNILGSLNILDAMNAVGASENGVRFDRRSDVRGTGDAPRAGKSSSTSRLRLMAYPNWPWKTTCPFTRGYAESTIRSSGRQTSMGLARTRTVKPESWRFSPAAMLAGEPVRIFGDGTDERDYVYVEDVVDALIRASNCPGTGPYNIGSGFGTSVNDVAARAGRAHRIQWTSLNACRQDLVI